MAETVFFLLYVGVANKSLYQSVVRKIGNDSSLPFQN